MSVRRRRRGSPPGLGRRWRAALQILTLRPDFSLQMFERFRRIRLLYIVLGTLLVVGLLPLGMAGWMLSGRSANELRSIEGRYQAQLVQDKARQIELFGQRYREVVTGLARAFELTGGVGVLGQAGSDERLQKTVEGDRNLDALAILPVTGAPHVAYKPDAVTREEVNARLNASLADMAEPGVRISGPHLISSSQEMALTIAAPVMGGTDSGEVIAAVVAVVSFPDGFPSVPQPVPLTERELLERGMPVLFVVNP